MSEHNSQNMMENRDAIIVRTSVLGIVANLFLAGFKAAVGLFSHSIAVVLDAVNNLSDALSSVITIIGTKLAGKKPDKKHPLGYGRVEYLSAMIIAAIVLYAGITSLVESIKKIITPETADYSLPSLVIIASAVVVKIFLGRYVKKTGEAVHSGSLVASGADALFDAVLSFSVLVSAIIYLTTGVSLEAYVGVAIALIIIKSGVDMLTETLDEILGSRVDRDLMKQIRETICEEESVSGAYDLILHSYGPERYFGSVHVEIPDTLTASQIDHLARRISERVFEKHGVVMTGIGIYALNTDEEISAMQKKINEIVLSHEGVLQTHGFNVNEEKKIIHLDVIIGFEIENRRALFEHIKKDIREEYPDYELQLVLDIDF